MDAVNQRRPPSALLQTPVQLLQRADSSILHIENLPYLRVASHIHILVRCIRAWNHTPDSITVIVDENWEWWSVSDCAAGCASLLGRYLEWAVASTEDL